MPQTPVPIEREDHRSVTARRKREAMRERILTALMHSFSDHTKVLRTIEDLTKAADISRGTFYKHFTTLDEAMVAAGRAVADRMAIDLQPIYEVLTDPVERVSAGMRSFISRALYDPRWAAFVLRAELVVGQSVVIDYVVSDVRLGDNEGVMDFDDLQAAADSVMGATIEGMRTLLLGRTQHPEAYIDSVIRITLRGLGVEKKRAREASAFSKKFVASLPNAIVDEWKAGH